MRQFERCLQVVDETTVLITSWFEPDQQEWRASAPQFMHVLHKLPASAGRGRSRSEAIRGLAASLTRRLSGPER
jgi:hypothetical protein